MSDYQFGMMVGRLRRALAREFELQAGSLEITVPQFLVLYRLWESDGMPTSALAAECRSDGATLTGILDRLEARGYLRRERCAEDRRAVRIFLTPAGRELREPLMQVVSAINARALEPLSEPERGDLIRLLERVGEHLGTQ